MIPGLKDSHIHLIRGGVNYLLELRWDGVPSLSLGLRMLREQAERTPPGQWVGVVGGWSGAQFAEKRLPTVLVLHLYQSAILNRAAIHRYLAIFSRLAAEGMFPNGTRWFFDHAETVSPRSIGSGSGGGSPAARAVALLVAGRWGTRRRR